MQAIMRTLYRTLLRLHPLAFREEFAGEMLWIFDEASAVEGVAPLFADGLLSLGRQWVFTRGTWIGAAAIVGGMMHMSLAATLIVPKHLDITLQTRGDAAYFSMAWPGEDRRPAPASEQFQYRRAESTATETNPQE